MPRGCDFGFRRDRVHALRTRVICDLPSLNLVHVVRRGQVCGHGGSRPVCAVPRGIGSPLFGRNGLRALLAWHIRGQPARQWLQAVHRGYVLLGDGLVSVQCVWRRVIRGGSGELIVLAVP